ncbi:MAG: hypothetical protein OEZ34_01720 [Spirochaetia bacterium]|nr:hypothetical protein [Spirochaetia bacterium]
MLKSFYSPRLCPVCKKEQPEKEIVCSVCIKHLEKERLAPSLRCEVCFNRLIRGACGFCSGRNIFFNKHYSLFNLSKHWMEFLHVWKFENDRGLSRFFNFYLKEILPVIPEDCLMLYLDSGKSGYDVRAYQPCRDICNFLSENSGLRKGGALKKILRHKQSGRSYRNRFLEIRDGYSTENLLPSRKYVVIEDVFTTGATGNETARILRNYGAEFIMIVSLLMRENDSV